MKNNIIKSFLGIVLVFVICIVTWLNIGYSPDVRAINYTKSTATVSIVNEAFGLSFIPIETQEPIGIIFYPGAKVEVEAYSPLAHKLAEQGYLTL